MKDVMLYISSRRWDCYADFAFAPSCVLHRAAQIT